MCFDWRNWFRWKAKIVNMAPPLGKWQYPNSDRAAMRLILGGMVTNTYLYTQILIRFFSSVSKSVCYSCSTYLITSVQCKLRQSVINPPVLENWVSTATVQVRLSVRRGLFVVGTAWRYVRLRLVAPAEVGCARLLRLNRASCFSGWPTRQSICRGWYLVLLVAVILVVWRRWCE